MALLPKNPVGRLRQRRQSAGRPVAPVKTSPQLAPGPPPPWAYFEGKYVPLFVAFHPQVAGWWEGNGVAPGFGLLLLLLWQLGKPLRQDQLGSAVF